MPFKEASGKQTILFILQLLFRIGVGGIFFVSGWGKWTHLAVFSQTVTSYHVLPVFWSHVYGALLPGLEVLFGLYLILGLFLQFSALALGLLLLSFGVAVGMVLLR